MSRFLPDTNIVSRLMRGDFELHVRLEQALKFGDDLILSPLVV